MGRAPCCDKIGLKKGPWTAEEDQLLVDFIRKNGHGNWRALPKQAGLLRCGKSCRLRWTNYLRPDVKRGSFSVEEEQTVIRFHELVGNRWSAIAARLPGRTDNEIKNVWNTHLKKRLMRMGIDPVTHRPTMPSSSVAQSNGYNFTQLQFPYASPTEHFSSTRSIDNDTISTVDSASISVPAKENEELNVCMNSVNIEGFAYNQIHSVENQFNGEGDFLINGPLMWGDQWPALSHESNEIPRFQEKSDQVSSLQPYDSLSGYLEDDDLFRELQNNMVDACTSTSRFHQICNMQLQKGSDCVDLWLNMLGQEGQSGNHS